jgi:ABC-type dipeptide/oligopeptide/nickel transport system permease subunit
MIRADRKSEAYLEIVWRQFRKNNTALIALWMLLPFFAIAVFAPLIASNQPLVFSSDRGTIYPWFSALFNAGDVVDYVFNMSLLGFLPWCMIALATNWAMKRREVIGPKRVLIVAGEFVGVAVVLSLLFLIPGLAPANAYRERSFSEEQFASPGKYSAVYVPIPLGSIEQDNDAFFKPPLFRKPPDLWKESNDGFIHLLGTDDTGRDVLVRMIYGTRISMTVGFIATSLYISIGVVLGALAGYSGGKVDILISRVIEIVILFPSFFLILTLVAMLGPSILIIMFVIGITGWTNVARLVRAEVLKQRANDYVQAARALGASHWRILFRHVLPNSLSPALVSAPFGIANAIITEAGLSLLGYGVRPPTPTWGILLNQGSSNYNYWWLIVVPSIAIFICVTVFNLVGSGLRDAMDPRLRV